MKINKIVILMWAMMCSLTCSSAPAYVLSHSPSDDQLIKAYVSQMIPRRERVLFFQLCDKLSIRYSLGAALGWHESSMKGYITSDKINKNGTVDRGYFQLSSGETQRFSKKYWNGLPFDPFDGKENMITGLENMRSCLDSTGNDDFAALRVYNAGPRSQRRGSPLGLEYAETVLNIEKEIIDDARLSFYESRDGAPG